MKRPIGHVASIYRYPIKSMAGERVESPTLGWHGIAGDRRFALRRRTERGGFPWLTASRLPELILYQPYGQLESAAEPVPTNVRTPDGRVFDLHDVALWAEIAERAGGEIELMRLNHGMFDESPVSLLSLSTTRAIEHAANRPVDLRRFRPNIVIEPVQTSAFVEDAWVGGTLALGEGDNAARIAITQRDKRCVMVNLDPDSAEKDAAIMRTIVGMNENCAGVYGTVVRAGELRVGATVFIDR